MPKRRAILAGSLMLAAISMAPAAMAGVIEVSVQEDTWVDGLSSGSPNGGDASLGICPVAEYWMYYKFDLSSVSGDVTDAELRLTRSSGSRPEEISLYHITDDTWSEATLTGLNRPDPVYPPDSQSLSQGASAPGYDRWSSGALAAVVMDDAAGDGVSSLMLRENQDTAFDVRFYHSREAAVSSAQKPRLVVTCEQVEVREFVASQATPTTFTWAAAGNSVYDVVVGTLSELRVDGGVSAAACAENDLQATQFVDMNPDPLPGEGRYYLARSKGGCGVGTYGYASGDVERLAPAGCP